MKKTQKENIGQDLPTLDGQISLDDVLNGLVDIDDGDLDSFNATFRSEVK